MDRAETQIVNHGFLDCSCASGSMSGSKYKHGSFPLGWEIIMTGRFVAKRSGCGLFIGTQNSSYYLIIIKGCWKERRAKSRDGATAIVGKDVPQNEQGAAFEGDRAAHAARVESRPQIIL